MSASDQLDRWVVYRELKNTDTPYSDDALETDEQDSRIVEPESEILHQLDAVDAIQIERIIDDPETDLDVDTYQYAGREPDVVFSGPPEPLKTRRGELVFAVPGGEEVHRVDPAQWVCQRCDALFSTGYDSTGVQEPAECPHCERDGPYVLRVEKHLPSNVDVDDMIPVPWKTPTRLVEYGFDDLWDDVRDWVWTYWDHPSEWLYDALTAFIISTWLRPNLDFLTHIVALGRFESGKTRLLNTISEIAYRGISPVSVSSAALYRSIDSLNLTMCLSEYHDLDQDLRQEVDAVIKGGQKRGEPVLRSSMTGSGGVSGIDIFDTFSHCGIGTQYDVADDIKSRSIVIETKPASREMPMSFDERDARRLRNRLLHARFKLLYSTDWFDAQQEAEAKLDAFDVTGRTREQLVGLCTVASIWGELDSMERVIERLTVQDERTRQESEDAAIVQSVLSAVWDKLIDEGTGDIHSDWSNLKIPYRDVIDAYEMMTGEELSSSKLGHLIKRLGLGTERYRDGTHIEDDDLRSKLQDLARDNNIEWTSPEEAESNPDLQLFDDEDSQSASDESPTTVAHDGTGGSTTASVTTADVPDDLEGVVANTHRMLVESGPLQSTALYKALDNFDNDDIDEAVDTLLRKGRVRDLGGGLLDSTE